LRKKHHHDHSQLDDLVRIIKEQGELMLAQVQAVVDITTTLKTTSDAVVAFVAANPPVSQADLDALTTVNTTLTGINTALAAIVTPKP
jgi:uncharacterized ion transporter superfamily protein YfcC